MLSGIITFIIALISLTIGVKGVPYFWIFVTASVSWAAYALLRPGVAEVMVDAQQDGSILKLHIVGISFQFILHSLIFGAGALLRVIFL